MYVALLQKLAGYGRHILDQDARGLELGTRRVVVGHSCRVDVKTDIGIHGQHVLALDID